MRKLEVGDILFYRGDSIISNLIRKIDGEFSHVAIYLGDDKVIEAQRFTKTRVIDINELEGSYEILRFNLDEQQKKNLLHNSHMFEGYPYDYYQIFSTLMNKLFKFKRRGYKYKFICSELAVNVFYSIGYFNKQEYDLLIGGTPNEIYCYLKYVSMNQ